MNSQLTPEDKLFIIENRMHMSMNIMAKEINKSYAQIRNYMITNNLQLN